MKSLRVSRGIALLFLGSRHWVGGQPHTPATSNPGKDPVFIVQEAGRAPGPIWTGAENLAPTRIPSPDRPARSQSLYRLSYSAHNFVFYLTKNNLIRASRMSELRVVSIFTTATFLCAPCLQRTHKRFIHLLTYRLIPV